MRSQTTRPEGAGRIVGAVFLWAAVFAAILGVLLIPIHPVIGLIMAGAGFVAVTWDWRGA